MFENSDAQILFLSWETPYPPYSGASLRTLGLLRELNKNYTLELLLLSRHPLSNEQNQVLSSLASRIGRLPLSDVSWFDKARCLPLIFRYGYPYHSAILTSSLAQHSETLAAIQQFQGIVFTSVGHWGALVVNRPAPNWVLNQCDADVEFWRVYAMQSTHSIVRLAARINYKLAHKHFSRIYSNVGRIIAVCEEDRGHTLSLSPQSKVDVIENGIDCSHYLPHRENRLGPPRLLFTGTSAARNIMALRIFVRDVLPLIQVKIPDVELVIGGNFSIASQSEFSNMQNIRFTGKVDDMRPYFNQSDVFISPFQETHGSKLKVAEAMAMAMPIVSTPQGVRGFALVDGESVMIARNANEFADHCIALLRQPERRLMLGQAAREVALATIDWKILGKRLNQIVGETLRDISKDRPEKTSVSE